MSGTGYRAKPGELQARRIDMASGKVASHSPGWPHLDRHGNCLCTGGCCLGGGGCRCRECSHRSHPRAEAAVREALATDTT